MTKQTKPLVSILMGSDSDLPVMVESAKILESLGIGYELLVTSAHRSPQRTVDIVTTAPERGVRVFVAGAGGAAHLAGVIAAHTTLPVLAVPLASSDLRGFDSLLATVQMPAGIPVGTLAVGAAGAKNAAWLAAGILALGDPALAARLGERRREMAAKVAKASEAASEKVRGMLSD